MLSTSDIMFTVDEDASAETPVNKLRLKLTFIGKSGVGKTALCRHFTNKRFRELTPATSGVERHFAFGLEEKPLLVELWDTVGADEMINAVAKETLNATLIRHSLTGSDAIFICLDSTEALEANRQTLEILRATAKKMAPIAPVYVILTKTDLAEKKSWKHDLESKDYVMLGACSAKNSNGVKELVQQAITPLIESAEPLTRLLNQIEMTAQDFLEQPDKDKFNKQLANDLTKQTDLSIAESAHRALRFLNTYCSYQSTEDLHAFGRTMLSSYQQLLQVMRRYLPMSEIPPERATRGEWEIMGRETTLAETFAKCLLLCSLNCDHPQGRLNDDATIRASRAFILEVARLYELPMGSYSNWDGASIRMNLLSYESQISKKLCEFERNSFFESHLHSLKINDRLMDNLPSGSLKRELKLFFADPTKSPSKNL